MGDSLSSLILSHKNKVAVHGFFCRDDEVATQHALRWISTVALVSLAYTRNFYERKNRGNV